VDLGGRRILDDLDLVLREGERAVLLGPNGAGKTTLVRAALGLLQTRSGWVRLHGFDPSETSGRRAAMERTGVCIEQPGIPGGVLAGRYLEWWARLHGIHAPRKRALGILSEWDIPADRPAERLSQGQRQILQVLRALIHDPRLLVLDEPSSFLDPDSRTRFHDKIRQWMERTGGALLLTTHHLDEALETADRIAMISEGRLRTEGSPESLGADPSLSRLLRLDPGQDPSNAARLLESAIPGILTRSAKISRGCPSLRVRTPRGEEDHAEVLARLCASGIAVRSLDRDETTWREFWNTAIAAPPRPGHPESAPEAVRPPPPHVGAMRSAWTTTRFHIDLALRERRMFLPILVLEAFALGSIALSIGTGIAPPQIVSILLLAGLLPLGLSASLAADTFAGERERRSLETLLCAPQTSWPLFLGKGLSALLPGLAFSWVATACAWAILRATGNPPDLATGLVISFAAIPSLGILSTAFALAASRRARTVRAAAQFAALSLLPILACTQLLPPLVAFCSPAHPASAWAALSAAILSSAALLVRHTVTRLSPKHLLLQA